MTSFGPDDLEALGDNVVLILETVKEMTQPEIMTMLRRTAHLVGEHPDEPAEPPSVLALARELRDPEVRRGLARVLATAPVRRRRRHRPHDQRRGGGAMTLATMNGREVHVDDEGFLTEYDEWDEDLAKVLAPTSAST
jgi:hypothetical protein